MLPKPEEVSKKKQKKQSFGGLGLRVSRILDVLRPPQVLAIFLLKTLPKPTEVSKNQELRVPGFEDLQDFCVFVFFETSSKLIGNTVKTHETVFF